MCNARAGLCGSDCRSLCGQAVDIIAIQTINLVLALGLIVVSGYFIFHGFRKYLLQKWDPVIATLVLIAVSSLLWFTEQLLATFNSVGYRDYSVILNVDGRFVRRMPVSLEIATSVLYGVSAVVGAVGLFILPLSWVRF
jgi:hypothetical protein